MTPDFFDLGYLARGSTIQQQAFRAINDSGIMNILKEFNPVVVGTLPLDLFTKKSDIDIISTFTGGEDYVEKIFFDRDRVIQNLHISRKELNYVDSFITTFEYEDFAFEIIGQSVPVKEQPAYRHMVAEWNILAGKDELFKRKILELKENGVKTEPAFAAVMGLEGDPYRILLEYEG